MTGFIRSRPGPRFWLPFYLLLDFGTWWPSLAGLAAQILVVAMQNLGPEDAINEDTVRYVSYGVFLTCAVLVLFGGKIYNTLEVVLGGKFLFVLFYMVICAVFYVSMNTWSQIWGGLINPWTMPRDAAWNPLLDASGNPLTTDWALISALAGFSGVGGMGNIMASNFVREKGWGMGGKVGAIPSAFGGHHITLSHLGKIFPANEEMRRRFQGWYKYLIVDQYAVWAVGSLFGMMLPCMLGAEYLKPGRLSTNEQWRWAAALAQDFGAVSGPVFRTLTLLCGLIIMIPGQFSVIDGVSRRWCDAVWSGSQRIRRIDPHNVKYIYYSFAGAYVVFGICAYRFFPKLSASSMMQIAGNMANLAIAATIFHTMYVNYRFLPRDARPGIGKQIMMILSGAFFLTMFGLVCNQKVLPIISQYPAWMILGAIGAVVVPFIFLAMRPSKAHAPML